MSDSMDIPDETESQGDEPGQQTIISLPSIDQFAVQLNFLATRQPHGSWLVQDYQGRFNAYFQNPQAFRHWAWTVLAGAATPQQGQPVYYFVREQGHEPA